MNVDLENTVAVTITKQMSESFSIEDIKDCQAEVHGNFVMVSYTKGVAQFIISLRHKETNTGSYELKVCEIANGVSTTSETKCNMKHHLREILDEQNFARMFLFENI